MTSRIAIPSKGRLREKVLELLEHSGYATGAFGRSNASALIEGIEFIEMRPRDAAAWLRTGKLDAAFISTDTALENRVEHWPALELGFSRSTLMVACREDAPYRSASDLTGATVATHLPDYTERWFSDAGIDVDVVSMGGSLEGICARGLADAIVDLRETGGSLARNKLHTLVDIVDCQAMFAWKPDTDDPNIDGLVVRLRAAMAARGMSYVMLHVPADRVDDLSKVFPGLASPTVLPLGGRDDLVAAHIVVRRDELWQRFGDLQAIGATGIVSLATDAIVE